jgi:hypothetical protein
MKHLAWLVLGSVPLLGVAAATANSFTTPPTLVDVVRAATERFRDPDRAIAEGYAPMPSCVTGPEEGAMGVHYVDGDLVGDGELTPDRPEAVIYEIKDGRIRLVGVEYIVIADAWNAAHSAPPALLGQQFHYVAGPNRYGALAFYELHVWAWRQNPKGTFVDWNPRVSCDEFVVDDSIHAHAAPGRR